jgi:hypothetical protein
MITHRSIVMLMDQLKSMAGSKLHKKNHPHKGISRNAISRASFTTIPTLRAPVEASHVYNVQDG